MFIRNNDKRITKKNPLKYQHTFIPEQIAS